MIPRKQKTQKAVLVLSGRGGFVRIDVAGLKPTTPVRVRIPRASRAAAQQAALTGVESFEGFVRVGWVAPATLAGVRVPVELTQL